MPPARRSLSSAPLPLMAPLLASSPLPSVADLERWTISPAVLPPSGKHRGQNRVRPGCSAACVCLLNRIRGLIPTCGAVRKRHVVTVRVRMNDPRLGEHRPVVQGRKSANQRSVSSDQPTNRTTVRGTGNVLHVTLWDSLRSLTPHNVPGKEKNFCMRMAKTRFQNEPRIIITDDTPFENASKIGKK